MKTKTVKLILTCGALLFALLFVNSCSSDDPAAVVDKAALELSITTANGLLATTIEGVGTGNYQRGSRASLAEAVTIAQVIADLPEASKPTVTGATASLNNAIANYE